MYELSDERCREVAGAFKAHPSKQKAADSLGIAVSTFKHQLKIAAKRGFVDMPDVMPGFEIKGVSTLYDAHGNKVQEWVKTSAEPNTEDLIREVVDALKEEIVPVLPLPSPPHSNEALLSQYTITDVHLGALAWHEETGSGDYDLTIAEQLLVDWFGAAIAASPPSKYAVLAQLGDFLHYDSMESVTPAHRHVLDADSRFPKMVRAAIRVLRKIISMLLAKHEFVHVVMADANHDPASEVWLRELFSALYEDEPRIKIDTNAGTYYVYEHGDVSLFYHHGHKRGIKDVDSVFAGRFRDIYGRTKFSYAHIGHLHSDELKSTNLMKVERHETLAAPDAYAANGGWLSGRSAKVIYYHKLRGEVGRSTITPDMVMTS